MADYGSSESKADLGKRLKKLFRLDREFSAAWRKEAKEDFAFVSGEQYSEEDKAHLKDLMLTNDDNSPLKTTLDEVFHVD